MKFFIMISIIVILPFAFPYTIVYLIKTFEKGKQNNTTENKNAAPPGRSEAVYRSNSSNDKTKTIINKSSNVPTSTILFLIGTAFVVLSGIAFGVASWVHTSHLGRVGIITAASLISFLICLITKKALKLSGTSIAFYVLGTGFASTAVLTAGFFRLMGTWFSFTGGGTAALLAVTSAFACFLMLIGCKLLKNSALMYPCLSCASLSLLFTACQIGDTIKYTALILIILQALITAYIYIYKHGKTGLPVKIVGTVSSVLYAMIASIYVLSTFESPDLSTFSIMAVILIQLVAYAAVTKEKIFIYAETICSLIIAYMISEIFKVPFREKDQLIVFSILSIFIWAVHKFIPFFRTRFTEGIAAAITIISSILCIISADKSTLILPIVISAIAALIVISYLFHNMVEIQIVAGILSPIIPLLMTERIIDCLSRPYSGSGNNTITAVCHSVLILLMILFTAFLLYSSRLLPVFKDKLQRKSDTVLYINMAVSGLLLFSLASLSDFVIITLILCIVHFAVSGRIKCNITSVIPALAFIAAVYNAARTSIESDLVKIIIMMTVFVIYILASRFIYFDGIASSDKGRIIIDPMILSAWLNIIFILGSDRTHSFFSLMATAIFIAGFIKKNTSADTKHVLLTFSVILSAFALIFRPFFIPDSMMISSKINMAIAALTGTALGRIWSSKLTANIMYILSFVSLMFDAIYFDNAANTIFAMAVMFAILMLSMLFHSKTWFIASSATLFSVTVYSTREYIMALSWWIYLFIAGMLLIALAAVNEYYRKKGTTFKDHIAKRFITWTW